MSIPRHVAIIMDGNRRWAREHNLPLLVGHTKGYNNTEIIVKHAAKRGITYLTFWAFSTENWNRSKEEVAYLMDIFRQLFRGSLVKRLIKEGVRIRTIGDLTPFPKDIIENVKRTVMKSKANTKLVVTIALNYGGRDEILRAVRKLVADKQKNIDASVFSQYLDTYGMPDPDLIIRTGGEKRMSGFLPWQSVYSEFYFTEKYWPEFGDTDLDNALQEYENRERRFGK